MSKISLIIKQEYKNKVAKKSFIVLTFLMPLLFVAMIMVPLWLSTIQDESVKQIAVVDQTHNYNDLFANNDIYKFELIGQPLDSLRNSEKKADYEAIVVITDNLVANPKATTIYSSKQVNLELKSYIEGILSDYVRQEKLHAYNVSNIDAILEDAKSKVNVTTVKWSEDGSEQTTSSEIAMVIGMVATLLIYMFIFVYGAQVMSSVVQEKTNRIVEVMVSSVKPFELMMGKIITNALVGLTQFAMWIVLTLIIFMGVSFAFGGEMLQEAQSASAAMTPTSMPSNSEVANILSMIQGINFGEIIIYFIVFFIGGYLLYASLFAAIGSAVDNETDTQQFMMPITIVVLFAFYAALYSAQNPDGPLAFWCSLIPFTSPIVMMVRIPFGVPAWQMAISISVLVLSFIGSVWVSAKIYRTGILMYGKKPSWKEIWKWLKY